MYLEQLGVFGWSKRDENLLLASLHTGVHGCAKTLGMEMPRRSVKLPRLKVSTRRTETNVCLKAAGMRVLC